MNESTKKQILDKIKEYNRIIIMRHFRPDGDAVGSTLGLREILRLSFPEKEILLINEDYSDYVDFLGNEDNPIPDELYGDALIIAIDTATLDRLSNKKYGLGRELIKIDHHVDIKPYGDISWVEDERSSACEMIADFYLTFSGELKINVMAATAIYAGMVTDSGRFRFRSVSGETLRLAAFLLEQGIDTDTLYAHLYLESFGSLKFKSYVLDKLQITENGVAYIHVDKNMREKFGLSQEEASNVVSYLDSIKGSIVWLAFIDNDDEKTTRVRLRSRFMTINKLAEQYSGGGHECASGATVHSEAEKLALLADADRLIKEYKENNGGWL